MILLQILPDISPALSLTYRHSITIGFAVTVQLKLYRLRAPCISGILPHLVRRDGNADARRAHHDAALTCAGGDGLGRRGFGSSVTCLFVIVQVVTA